ncbi:hypothetical protein F3C99_11315 [Vitellibacter sp. q18]|nr:hypothetical protein [Aequorivita lutea]
MSVRVFSGGATAEPENVSRTPASTMVPLMRIGRSRPWISIPFSISISNSNSNSSSNSNLSSSSSSGTGSNSNSIPLFL